MSLLDSAEERSRLVERVTNNVGLVLAQRLMTVFGVPALIWAAVTVQTTLRDLDNRMVKAEGKIDVLAITGDNNATNARGATAGVSDKVDRLALSINENLEIRFKLRDQKDGEQDRRIDQLERRR
jgi:hypothetical protein